MTGYTAVRSALFVAAASGLACGGETPPAVSEVAPAAPETPAEVVLGGLDVVFSDAAADLSTPAAIDVDGDGNLWIVDQRLSRMLIVSPDGELLRTIGRNGEGPGEFRFPRGIGIRGDQAYVLDNVHGVQAFDMEGEYVREYSLVPVYFDFDFTGDGGVVTNNNRVWGRGGMVMVIGPDGEERALFGEPPFPVEDGFDLRAMREQILEGTIPDPLRNGALPVAAPDGTIWLAIHTEATIRRYGADGTLLAETTYDLPEMSAIVDRYLADFAAAPQGDLFFFPSLIGAGYAVGDHLCLLWETARGEPGLVTVHGPEGDLVQRLVIPGLDLGDGGMTRLGMAIDVSRRRLYVTVSDIATVFGVDLPEAVVF